MNASYGSTLLALALLACGGGQAGTPPTVGSAAPPFSLQDQAGKTHTLADYNGRWLVVYFYPKDGTPGCTKQVCAFRDSIEKVRQTGADVVGVSVDDVESHKEFADEHGPFSNSCFFFFFFFCFCRS